MSKLERKTGRRAAALLPVFSVPSIGASAVPRIPLLEVHPDAAADLRATDAQLVRNVIQLHRCSRVANVAADSVALSQVVVHTDRTVETGARSRLPGRAHVHVLGTCRHRKRFDDVLAQLNDRVSDLGDYVHLVSDRPRVNKP